MIKTTIPEVTIESLRDCGYQDIISVGESDPLQYSITLEKAGKEAFQKGESSRGNALNFLSMICSLMLRPSDIKTPFAPCSVYPDKSTSTKVSDFSNDHANVLVDFVANVQDPELAARIADLAWMIKRGNPSTAICAIHNYIKASSSSFCEKNWEEPLKRLERALRLAKSIGEIALFNSIKDELIAQLEPGHKLYSLLAIRYICPLLLEFKLLEPIAIGEKIEASLLLQPTQYEFHSELLLVAAQAYSRGKDLDRYNNAKIMSAEFLVKKAEGFRRPGQMIAAAHFYSQAIAGLQQCQGQQMRVAELQHEIEAVNKESLKEMKTFSLSIDITELTKAAILAMQNKESDEALLQFSSLFHPVSRKELEKRAIAISNENVLLNINDKLILNGDGRLVEIVPPLITSTGEDYDLALKWATYQQAFYQQSLMVNAIIIPARNELVNFHLVNEKTLSKLLRYCPLFLSGRESLWIKGFLAGFYGEFDVALSLLIPQFEHSLRKCLESRGAIVWSINPTTKIHSEILLNKLLGMKEARDLLGENLQFELQGLLVERVGFNFRNEFAHGLMSESSFYSVSAIYLWWLLFRMAIFSFKTEEKQIT